MGGAVLPLTDVRGRKEPLFSRVPRRGRGVNHAGFYLLLLNNCQDLCSRNRLCHAGAMFFYGFLAGVALVVGIILLWHWIDAKE